MKSLNCKHRWLVSLTSCFIMVNGKLTAVHNKEITDHVSMRSIAKSILRVFNEIRKGGKR